MLICDIDDMIMMNYQDLRYHNNNRLTLVGVEFESSSTYNGEEYLNIVWQHLNAGTDLYLHTVEHSLVCKHSRFLDTLLSGLQF